jgi:hypothetical protein
MFRLSCSRAPHLSRDVVADGDLLCYEAAVLVDMINIHSMGRYVDLGNRGNRARMFECVILQPQLLVQMDCNDRVCQPFKDRWQLYVPPRLAFTNFTFCPHSVCVCVCVCVYVFCGSENKQQLFTYTTFTDFFMTETECVYCAVRTKLLNIIPVERDVESPCQGPGV